MRMISRLALAALLLAAPAARASVCDLLQTASPPLATPFVCHGQTAITPANLEVVNPTPNTGSVLGECTALPYFVPAGATLIVTAMHLEGSGYGSGMYLFTGTQQIASKVMTSLESQETPSNLRNAQNWQASVQFTDLNWWFPAGTQINLDVNDALQGVITAWDFSGCLKSP